MKSFDYVVVGGGVVGLAIARELARHRAGSICVLEKEARLGLHASGRNSGVLHAGLYYTPDSLKARFCADGSRRMQAYAHENGIACVRIGKVVVAQHPHLTGQLDMLEKRACSNGVKVERVDLKRLRQIEPEATSYSHALYSPDTAIIDSRGLLEVLAGELDRAGVRVSLSSAFAGVSSAGVLRTHRERFAFGHLINAAGLYADRVAACFGAGKRYRIVPFKGWYRTLRPQAAERIRGLIYPVPDPELPFLGVHLTRHTDGHVSAGPTAFPAFGREHYGVWRGLDWRDTPRIAWAVAGLWLGDQGHFRRLASEEMSRCASSGFYHAARQLAPFLRPEDIVATGGCVGIRAQLIERSTGQLEMDFVVERAERSTHILNAVSPGFTSSFAFAEYVVRTEVLKISP